jgi:adenylosuccinate synthase
MPVTVIEGEQRGDEGKGRFVDMLMEEFDIGARFNGGDNAGHTVVAPDGEVYKLHGLPTSVVHAGKMSVIGNGTVVNPLNLTREIDTLAEQGVVISPANLLISSQAHLILPHHIEEDCLREEGKGAQGSTKSGIAQVYRDKAARVGLRAEIIKNDPDGLRETVYDRLRTVREVTDSGGDREKAEEYVAAARRLGEFVTDTVLYLNRELARGSRVLAEGAQAFLLDIDHGMYPFVTSSSTTSAGVAAGLGVPGRYINQVIGVSKAIQSHVGGGPFVTEIDDTKLLGRLHGDMTAVDAERGTTTQRTRRLGHLDLPQIKRSQMINGTDEMALTKLDWVSRYEGDIPICIAYERKGKRLDIAPDAAYKLEQSTPIYQTVANWRQDIQDVRRFEDLPEEAQQYVRFIEKITGTLIGRIGVGPGRDQVITDRR